MKKWLLIFVSTMMVFLMSPTLFAGNGPTLEQWITRALQKNPNYLLSLKDHQLVLDSLQSQEAGGATKVSFSLGTMTITDQGLQDNYSIALHYGWKLPNDLSISGFLDAGELKNPHVTGNLGLSINLLDFLRSDKQSELAVKYLETEQAIFTTKATLIKNVVDKYYQIFQRKIDLALAEVELRLAEAQFEQKKKHYSAGRISALEFFQVADQVSSLTTSYQEADKLLTGAKLDFARLYGMEVNDKLIAEIDQFSTKPLTLDTHRVDKFIDDFNPDNINQYIKNISSYQENLLVVKQKKLVLEETHRANQWQINLGTSIDYGTSPKDFGVSGTINLCKELYNPENKRKIQRAKTELARVELALEEKRIKLSYELVQHIEKIENLNYRQRKALEDFRDAQKQNQRLQKQYAAGYIAKNDLLSMQVILREKEQILLQAQFDLLTEKLALNRLLSLDLL